MLPEFIFLRMTESREAGVKPGDGEEVSKEGGWPRWESLQLGWKCLDLALALWNLSQSLPEQF